jgi:formylglycine-generating enzyme required for sulfatase activity
MTLHNNPEPKDESESEFERENIHLPQMVEIPAGVFWMGTSKQQVMRLYEWEQWAQDWHRDGLFRGEQPQHKIELPAFEIAIYPVTNEEYRTFIWESGYKVPKGWLGFRYPEGLEKHPVVGVTKEDCEQFCDWLNKSSGINFRLPTEAEWEKAARGPTPRVYPWGDEFDPWRCNTLESNKGGTTQVGSFSPAGDSPFGVADMAGNVYEWTNSRLLPYPFQKNPPAPAPGESVRWILRGGAWYYSRKLARCASREGVLQDNTSPALGFRVARSL